MLHTGTDNQVSILTSKKTSQIKLRSSDHKEFVAVIDSLTIGNLKCRAKISTAEDIPMFMAIRRDGQAGLGSFGLIKFDLEQFPDSLSVSP